MLANEDLWQGLWDLVPSGFNVFDLLATFREHDTTVDNDEDESAHVTMSSSHHRHHHKTTASLADYLLNGEPAQVPLSGWKSQLLRFGFQSEFQ